MNWHHEYCIINNCNIKGKSDDYCMYIQSDAYNISVKNCNLYDGNRGLYLHGTDCKISGNSFYDIADRALWLHSNCVNPFVSKNYFNNVGTVIDNDVTDATILDNIGYDYNTLFPYYEQDTPPILLQNTTAYWYNTTGGWGYVVYNMHGTQFYWNGSTTY